jgi:hypothetical protein
MRRPVTALSLALVLAAFALPAAAAKPDRVPIEIPGNFLAFPAGAACEFPVSIEILVNREYVKTWTDADGNPIRAQTNGSLRIRVINDITDESVDLNVGGPGRNLYQADGTVEQLFLGHGLPIFEGVFYGTLGLHSFLVDGADFSLIEVGRARGQIIDVCAMIE